ncbi:zeta toxin family protein [Spirosoma sp. KUDC1026]|uniref:zeta toxin family protein n=1 Tax=Spirosoma sp. KUDC1026 TaxID=2745947 RepID=UPI00159BE5DD|nr:zeta toxin family protein [Spirosoma sp. KUDC1026]QKZ14578.1 zeta toxin family protein [Spirosoma sp. KUDC1026]
MPNLYILAGPNGAGKTTAAYTLLPEVLGVVEFVNADEIARGLSPFNVESVAFEAGRLMLQRIDQLLDKQVDFAFETTLSTRSYVQTIKRAQQAGYSVKLYYFWLPSADMSKERVARRVARGGHNIPTEVIERRYSRSIKNLVQLYQPICTHFTVFDNSGTVAQRVASGGMYTEIEVFIEDSWVRILAYGN